MALLAANNMSCVLLMQKKHTNSKAVTIFLPSLNGGGAERVMVTLANAIAARGFKVDLVLASAVGPYLDDVSPEVRIVDLKAGRVSKAFFPLVQYLRHERPTALLSAMGHCNVVAILACRLARAACRVVVSERGTISKECELAHSFSAKINFFLVKLIYRWADAISTVSESSSIDLAKFVNLPLAKIKTIYNPFDLSRIGLLACADIEHAWFKPGQLPVIVAMGRLNEAKDFSVLLAAFSLLRCTHNVRLLLLGEGELRSLLERQVSSLGLSESVELPGFISNPHAYLARASLFVLSSRREGLPGALIEAMACGTPVVSTNCVSGPDEILEGGRWGKLVPVGDVNALAGAMAEVLDTPKNQLPNVRERAQDFEQERAVDAYLELLGMPLYANAGSHHESDHV